MEAVDKWQEIRVYHRYDKDNDDFITELNVDALERTVYHHLEQILIVNIHNGKVIYALEPNDDRTFKRVFPYFVTSTYSLNICKGLYSIGEVKHYMKKNRLIFR